MCAQGKHNFTSSVSSNKSATYIQASPAYKPTFCYYEISLSAKGQSRFWHKSRALETGHNEHPAIGFALTQMERNGGEAVYLFGGCNLSGKLTNTFLRLASSAVLM